MLLTTVPRCSCRRRRRRPQSSAQFLCICNTVLSLLGSTLSTFATSAHVNGKLNAVAVQNATLAGGVAMGAACTLHMVSGCCLAACRRVRFGARCRLCC
jgi:ammonia channel protein AmtB